MRYYLLLLLLIVGTESFGQKLRFSYHGNHWISRIVVPDITFNSQSNYTTDTVAFGMVYKRIVKLGGTTPTHLIREDSVGGRVYYRNLQEDTSERILYDYNLLPGDTISYIRPWTTHTDSVVGIDSTLINGIWHKVWHMHNTGVGHGRAYSVVEGLGCTSGPFYPAYFVWCFEYEERLLCFSRDTVHPAINAPYVQCGFGSDPIIYNNDSFVNSYGCIMVSANNFTKETTTTSISPNPATDHINITTSADNATVSIHSTTGACIFRSNIQPSTIINTTQWTTGLYIVVIQNETGILKREKIIITH